jgi:glycosyltransferase involved in cell wall biosynthesis
MTTARKLVMVYLNLRPEGEARQIVHLVRHMDPAEWLIKLILLEREGLWLNEISSTSAYFLTSKMPRGWRLWPWTASKVYALRRQLEGCDIIMPFGGFPCDILTALAVLGKRKKPKVVWAVQAEAQRMFAFNTLGRLRARLAARLLRSQVDSVIAVSEGIKTKLQAYLSIDPELIEVIPNAVDLQDLACRAREDLVPSKEEGRLRLVAIARLQPQKGLQDLLQALARVKGHFDFECFILGEGPERSRLENLARQLDLSASVHCIGVVSNPYAWLKSADLFVLPSHLEPFGVALIEAMAVGLPVIATCTDGSRDIITPDRDGILVAVRDVEALAQAILMLARSPERGRSLGQLASRRARDFDISVISKRYQHALGRVLYAR